MTVEVTGADETAKTLRNYAGRQARKGALQAVLFKIEADLGEYPASSEANSPPTPFYIRGRGTQTASGNTLTSEQMNQRWETKIPSNNFNRGRVTNNASYSPFVIGDKQTAFHKRRGWPNVPAYTKARIKLKQLEKIYAKTLEKLVFK